MADSVKEKQEKIINLYVRSIILRSFPRRNISFLISPNLLSTMQFSINISGYVFESQKKNLFLSQIFMYHHFFGYKDIP